MKSSLRVFVTILGIIALVTGGAILGALLPAKIMVFTVVTIAAIAALGLIFIGYKGHKDPDEE